MSDAAPGTAQPFDFAQLESVFRVGGGSAVERATQIVAEAQAEAGAIRAEAEAAGRAEGLAAGRAEAAVELAPAAATLAQAAAALEGALQEANRALERRAVELALALAEKIVAASLELRPELVVDAVTAALRGVLDRDRLVVAVNPDDLELVRGAAEQIRGSLGIERLELIGERRVARGGCVVTTSEGEIDAAVATRVERAHEVLAQALTRA